MRNTTETGIALAQFWAKTTSGGLPALSVRDHCLYVGYVAQAVLERMPTHVRKLLPAGISSLVALHDVGKISPGFQRKCDAWRESFETGLLARDWSLAEKKHALVSHAIVGHWLGEELAGYSIAVGGHHGNFYCDHHLPDIGTYARDREDELADRLFSGPRHELREIIEQTLGALPQQPLDSTDEALIVALTGLMTFADWLGSNETFFKSDPATYAVPEPLIVINREGRKMSATVMNWLRWGETAVRSGLSFTKLFPYPPNATQRALCELAGRPGLFIVEAPMGNGKTEAALGAAYCRWTTGEERGLYFALPTQLSSERIFDRVETFLSRALERPGLIALAHGNSWLRGENRVLEVRPAENDDEAIKYAREARLWFASNRQGLLAPFGGGTVDQALLGVLPVKHCGLRLFGLTGKVVVLDEIHSYDRYTGTLVELLIRDLLRLGATVIVLTATLTAEHKRRLLLAAGVAEQAIPAMSPDDAYPMITTAYANGEAVTKAVPFASPGKAVALDHRSNSDSRVWNDVIAAASTGACVLVVRNTVRLSQETYATLRIPARSVNIEIGLLHSQFPRWRRDELESHWIPALGKDGSRPKGCILVSTQIVEQSLDIDCDLLITDLAPTELLLQRIGRLHRHELSRPDKYREPRTIILHPQLSDEMDAGELRNALNPSGRVYPPYTLYRAHRHWTQHPSVWLPSDIRPWIEATYAPMSDLPVAVQELMENWIAKGEELADTAKVRSLRLNHEATEDQDVFTRWETIPSANLVLLGARSQSGRLVLLDGQTIDIPRETWSFEAAKALYLNTVKVPYYAATDWNRHNPAWILDYVDDPVVGVVEDGAINPLGPVDTNYTVSWTPESGVEIESAGRELIY